MNHRFYLHELVQSIFATLWNKGYPDFRHMKTHKKILKLLDSLLRNVSRNLHILEHH